MDDNEKNLIKGIYVRKPKEDVEEESRRSQIQDIIYPKVKGRGKVLSMFLFIQLSS